MGEATDIPVVRKSAGQRDDGIFPHGKKKLKNGIKRSLKRDIKITHSVVNSQFQ